MFFGSSSKQVEDKLAKHLIQRDIRLGKIHA